MAWYYVLGGASQGPVELTELQRLRQQNVVAGDTPVWTDGMSEWVAYAQSSAAGAIAGGVPVSSGGMAVTLRPCVECGRSLPESEMVEYEGKWVCATCKPLFFQRLKEGVALPGVLNYAGVGRRFAAILIDGLLIDLVVFLPIVLIFGLAGLTSQAGVLSVANNVGITLFEYLVPALYEILMIGAFGATLGKMAMGIKVTTPAGEPISYGRSTGRYFAKILSGIILGIGYLMAFWDPERQALHDRICATRVITAKP